MRCKICDYRLWNLTSRQCPECGTPFLPSDHEFTTNSVQFQCPHCNQSYYGTGAKGHLVPPAFECVGCERNIHMNEMVLLPTEGVDEEETKVGRSPWLDRKRIGFFKGWVRTVGKAMVGPRELIQATPANSSIAEAMWFGMCSQLLMFAAAIIPFLLIQLVFVVGFMGGMGGAGPSPLVFVSLGMAAFLVAGFVLVILQLVFWALLTHLALRLTGRTTAELGRTMQVMSYSSGANVVSGVPFIGGYFGWLWWAVSAVIMLRQAQGVSTARAVLSVASLPVLMLAGFAAFMWIAVFGSNSWATQAINEIPNAEVQTVLDGLLAYAEDNNGAVPHHAIDLVIGEQLDEYDWVTADSATDLSDIPVGALTLEEFATADDAEREAAALEAEAALPPETIAHRLGDFVFAHHGMDLDAADGGLWVVVRWEDPDVNGMGTAFGTNHPVWVGLASGEVRSILTSLFDNELKRQNDLRAEHRLAELPHPENVTHDTPAVGLAPEQVTPATP